MARDPRYNLIRPKYKKGEIRLFSDIFQTLPKSLVAKDLGKEKGRFTELVNNPNEFTWSELKKFSSNCEMSIAEFSLLIEKEHPNDQPRTFKYPDVKMMFEEGKLQRLEDIFHYVTKTTVAADLGKKRDTLNRLIENADRFTFRDIRSLAELSGLALNEILTLLT
ncbi:MAG TPA: hypothetical protein VL978_16995 [Puia sp.]|nr:hypothetical protein [Puia sp.]